MLLESNKIKAVIFDLGGVIVDLEVERTIQAFANLSGLSTDAIKNAYHAHPGFYAYERGLISDGDFRQVLRELFTLHVSDAQLDLAWNAMLVDLPAKKLMWLVDLKSKLQVYALSNTNNIHISYVNEVMLKGSLLDDYFHRCYYSHHVNMRKPDYEIYEHVLSHAALDPQETLFLDDNPYNIKAAKVMGIQAVQVNHPDEVYTILNWL